MKIFTLLAMLSACISLQAQQLLFDKTIPEKDIQQAFRLKNEMQAKYVSSRYVSQADFLTGKDFYILLTPELLVKSKFNKIHQYPTGSFSYEGKLEGAIKGDVSFSKYQDRTSGMIILEDGKKFMIDQHETNIYSVSLLFDGAFSQQDNLDDFIIPDNTDQKNESTLAGSICDLGNTCTEPSVIDLMIVYTQDAENKWGGNSNTVANITQAVTNMTISMTNSGINNVSFRLVHTEKVTYTESGSFSTDLSRLAGTSDGYMDNVHALRNQYGADMVSLIIGSPTSSCGIGYLNTSTTSYSANNGFNVSLYSCVVGNYTMAHEFGHNMGLRHDWYVDQSTSPCSHHHGYVNQAAISQGTSSPSSARWRTIMAYNNQCNDAGFSCTRLNRWSNPVLTYNGDVTGNAIGNTQPSDEAYAFYRMACMVAAFRAEASSCTSPSGLSASAITTSSATLNWTVVSGANNYDVDYKLASSSTWINIATATTSTSINLSSLSSATLYDWRVRANCASGSSSYFRAHFSTQSPPTCNAPSGLTISSITSTGATVSWSSVSGANNYDVDYKAASSATWINAVSGTTSLSRNISGLSSSTLYDWKVRANCTGLSSGYSSSQFTTTAPPAACPGPYDISTNGNIAGAGLIPLNTEIKGTISTKGDNDYYKFIISTAGSITVSLSTLPANYNLALLNSNGSQMAISQKNGTATETINSTVAAGEYYARVFPKGNASNASTCYTLNILTGTAADLNITNESGIRLFPNPAHNQLNVLIDGLEKKTNLKIYDITGKEVMQQLTGTSITQIDISKLTPGFYMLKISDGEKTISTKFVKK